MVKIRYGVPEDFDIIYKLFNSESDSVGPVFPLIIRERIAFKECIIAEEDGVFLGVCNFHILKREEYATIYELAITKEARRRGIAKLLVQFILDTYKRSIYVKCIKGIGAEKFWSTLGTYVSEQQSKKTIVCKYFIKNPVKLRKGLLDK